MRSRLLASAFLSLILTSSLAPAQSSAGAGPGPSPYATSIAPGTDLTTGTVTATGGNTARTNAAINADLANPLFYGADPTGVSDSATAINNSASNTPTKSVHLPGGTYYVKSQIGLSNGECLYGDGDHVTFLKIDQTFSSSANGVVSLSGLEDATPCVHDLAFVFAQPPDVRTTANGAASAGQNQITVASTANISVGNYIIDVTTTTAIPSYLNLSPGTTVTNIAGNVLTLSANLAGSGALNGDTLAFGPTRAQFQTLSAGCTTSAGGTGCKYPPAIYAVGANTNRPRFWNIHIEGAWDCINNTGNVAPWIKSVECGALDTGWQLDGSQDFTHVEGWHEWVFGLNSYALTQIVHDGSTNAWVIGNAGSLNAVDITFYSANLSITSGAGTGSTQIDNLSLDSGSQLNIAGGASNIINDLNLTSNSSVGTCVVNVSGGLNKISHSFMQVAGGGNWLCQTGGTLKLTDNNFVTSNGTIVPVSETAGSLFLQNNYFSTPATITSPMVSSTGGSIVATGNVAHSGTSGTAISISTDNASNFVSGNYFMQYGYSLPSGTVTGFYLPGSIGNYGASGGIPGGTTNSNLHFVTGSGNLSAGVATVNFAGLSVFISSTSYTCVATDVSGSAVTMSTQNQSSSQFKVFGTGTDAYRYFCVGQ